MKDILNGLNNKQYEAVINTDGPCLVIAGAGSGKTKVLTHKIAYLLNEKNIKPWNILAITFTNKAANEMKSRVEMLVGEAAKDKKIIITLRANENGEKVISGLKRISKPGLRVYAKSDAVPRVLNGLGIAIISTSHGLMTDRDARKQKLGGEVVAYVW